MAQFADRALTGGNNASAALLRRVAPAYLKPEVKPFVKARSGGHGMPWGARGFNRPRIKVRQPSVFANDLLEGLGPGASGLHAAVRVRGTPAFVKRYLYNVFGQRLAALEQEREGETDAGQRERLQQQRDALIDKYEGLMAEQLQQGADQSFETGFRGFLMGNYQADDLQSLMQLSQHSPSAAHILGRRIRWTHTPGVYPWLASSVANRQAFDNYIMMMHEFGPVHPLWQEGYGTDLWALYLYYKYVVAGAGFDDGYDNEDLAFHALWADSLPPHEQRPGVATGRYTRDSHQFPGPNRAAGAGPPGYNPEATADAAFDALPALRPGVASEPPAHVMVPATARPRRKDRPPVVDEQGGPTDPTEAGGTQPVLPVVKGEPEDDERKRKRGQKRGPSGNGRGRG